MTPEQAQLVRISFVRVMDIKMQAGQLFYDRLFTIAPEVRPMFKGDMDSQVRKLMDTLAIAIGNLKNPSSFGALIEDLAQRHKRYGVADEHYDKVGEALLWTLEQGLGADFTAEVRSAWAALYAMIAQRMKSAGSAQIARA